MGSPRVARTAVVATALLFVACGRTWLAGDEGDGVDATVPFEDAGLDADAEADAPVVPADGPVTPGCTPVSETCNGRDDDCDGTVDDGLDALPCAGGGARYCVAGRYSECPRRCDVCVPGSERICFVSFCEYWGVQTCAADGRGFGACREAKPPGDCKAVAKAHQDSRELEQCCIDAGYCCIDRYDLDHDGVRGDHLGACEDVTCE